MGGGPSRWGRGVLPGRGGVLPGGGGGSFQVGGGSSR